MHVNYQYVYPMLETLCVSLEHYRFARCVDETSCERGKERERSDSYAFNLSIFVCVYTFGFELLAVYIANNKDNTKEKIALQYS